LLSKVGRVALSLVFAVPVFGRYSFLDARGVGALDGAQPVSAYEQLLQGDMLDVNWRPPKVSVLSPILVAAADTNR
jgi:hypothetical protein